MSGSSSTRAEHAIDFDGLTIRFDDRVLRPRPWTVAQSRWAAALLADLPPGPVLELCAGAAQIGLAAVAGSRRRLLCVDRDPVASAFAAVNARGAGLTAYVEVRTAAMTEALTADETFVLVIADPPWVRRDETGRYPEDPLTAIDGGPDGLDVARECLEVIGVHLAPGGVALMQLGAEGQVVALENEIASAGLRTAEVRGFDAGVVVRLGPAAGPG
ncbi:MAG TPA: RsmD family RNA methyltransferase [Nocardioides sp.]|nr:RsmD family RNA methyltransferase [Nocardioides sp.]